MPSQVICNFHKDPIKIKQAVLWTRWNMFVLFLFFLFFFFCFLFFVTVVFFFFGTRGQVTPKSIVQSGWESNSSEILCPSGLSASFIKFQLKLIRIYFRKSQIWSVPALTSNSKVNSPIWPELEFIRDFMHVHVICKFHKDPIKNKKCYAPDKIKYCVFPHLRASNSDVNSLI